MSTPTLWKVVAIELDETSASTSKHTQLQTHTPYCCHVHSAQTDMGSCTSQGRERRFTPILCARYGRAYEAKVPVSGCQTVG